MKNEKFDKIILIKKVSTFHVQYKIHLFINYFVVFNQIIINFSNYKLLLVESFEIKF